MRSNHEALEGLKLREKLRESFAAQQRADLAEAEGSQASQRLTSEAAERPSGKQDFQGHGRTDDRLRARRNLTPEGVRCGAKTCDVEFQGCQMMLCQLSAILGFQGCGTSVVLRWLYAQMQLSKRLKLQEKLRESFAAQQRADLTEAEGEPTGKPKEDEKSKDDLVRKLKQAEQERQAEQESAGARARGAAPTAFHQAVRQARFSLRRRARQRRAHR